MSLELRVPVHDGFQILLAKAIGIDVMQGLVEELRLAVEEVFVTANNRLLAEFDVEVALLLVTEANAVLARLLLLLVGALSYNVNLLIYLVIFLEDVFLGRKETGLQVLEHKDHELRVLRVLPAIVVGVEVGPAIPLPALLLHPKVYMELINEISE